jgi:hypothetical protein
MKKSIIGVMSLLAGAFVAHGQGTVSFGNYAHLGTYLYVQLSSGVLLGGTGAGDPTPTLSNWALQENNGAQWTVSLYGSLGTSQPMSQMSPLGVSTALEIGNGVDSTAGTWYSTSSAVFSSAPNGTVATLQLYAWYNDGGTITSYAQALAESVPAGYSALANVTLGAPPAPPTALPESLGNVIIPVPEPSTIALGIVGASTFLMRLRRKQ